MIQIYKCDCCENRILAIPSEEIYENGEYTCVDLKPQQVLSLLVALGKERVHLCDELPNPKPLQAKRGRKEKR